MGALNFRSRLAPYIIGLIEQKRALGYKYTAQVKILQKFDMLCAERFSEDSTVTKAMLDVWAVTMASADFLQFVVTAAFGFPTSRLQDLPG